MLHSDVDGVWLTQDYITYPDDNKVFSRTRYDVVLTKETQRLVVRVAEDRGYQEWDAGLFDLIDHEELIDFSVLRISANDQLITRDIILSTDSLKITESVYMRTFSDGSVHRAVLRRTSTKIW